MVPPDLIALAQSGAGIALASCDASGRPVLGLGVGCRIQAGGQFRILIDRVSNAQVLAAITEGKAVAVTMTSAYAHTSFQVKACHAQIVDICCDDQPEIDRQQALLRDGLIELGFTLEQATGYAPYHAANLVAVEFLPERVFSQTPGPGAGREINR